MISVLNRAGLTRDSALLWVGILTGVVGFLGAHFDLLQRAIPSLGPVWQARIELVSALLGIVSAYLRMSPLAINPDSDVAGPAKPQLKLNLIGQLPKFHL